MPKKNPRGRFVVREFIRWLRDEQQCHQIRHSADGPGLANHALERAGEGLRVTRELHRDSVGQITPTPQQQRQGGRQEQQTREPCHRVEHGKCHEERQRQCALYSTAAEIAGFLGRIGHQPASVVASRLHIAARPSLHQGAQSREPLTGWWPTLVVEQKPDGSRSATEPAIYFNVVRKSTIADGRDGYPPSVPASPPRRQRLSSLCVTSRAAGPRCRP